MELLPGVSPRHAVLIRKAAGPLAIDLLWHLPFSILDRRLTPSISEGRVGTNATLRVRVGEHRAALRRGRPYRVEVSDGSGSLSLVFFNLSGGYLQKLLPTGEEKIISGRLESYDGFLQMAHPDLILPATALAEVGKLMPVYRSTAGLPPAVLEKTIAGIVEKLRDLPEWIDAALSRREKWSSWREAVQTAHRPQSEEDLNALSPARRRLAYDEVLAHQLTLALVRNSYKREHGRTVIGTGDLRDRALKALGFELTGSQRFALAEIYGDMAGEGRMLRLLQGDVGSGKTLVALLSMLLAVEANGQAALMAPTEILARQHFKTIEPICGAIGVRCDLLLGQGRGQSRSPVLLGMAEGSIQLVIGTHALLQEAVQFRDLRLAVIDEQHRFGVDNRLTLAAKGHAVDTLLMTATPIPRTLSLAAHGDLDVSRLTEKPAGRKPIDTRVMPLDRLEEVLAGIGRRIADGARVYWVCPLVEETEDSDFAAAKQRSITLAERFGPAKVGLVHGRLKAAEKAATMEAFAAGRIAILVATTVIEVGVDVPEATIMVIEHAERYGLAQLHQLRGRIGRGEGASTCLLLYSAGLTRTGTERLRIIRESEDGFFLAEEDLRLRREGDMLGTKQSGMPDYRIADINDHLDLIEIADSQARVMLERDPDLAGPDGKAARVLLDLFQRQEAVRYSRSG